MRYYRIEIENELFAVGIGSDGTEISPEEYYKIKEIIGNRPAAPEGQEYFLTSSLEWRTRALPAVSDEISDAEALGIILGGAL